MKNLLLHKCILINFIYTQFRLLNKASISTLPIENAFSEYVYQDDDDNKREPENENETESLTIQEATLKKAANLDPLALLKFGVADGIQTAIDFALDHQLFNDRTVHPLEGTWTAETLPVDAPDIIVPTLRLSLHVYSNQGKLTGIDEELHSAYAVEGIMLTNKTGYEVTLTSQTKYNLFTGTGTFDKDTGVLTITWNDRDQPVPYRRIPAFSAQYRYTPDHLSEDALRSRWDFLRSSVLHIAQQRLWRDNFLQARLRERLRFFRLTLRAMIASANYSPQQPLDVTEVKELKRLTLSLTPAEAQFYRELAIYQFQSEPDHL